MPTIYIPTKKRISDKKTNLDHIAVYNTSTWKNLRKNYLKENTLCVKCLKQNKITLANDIHHIIYLSTETTLAGKKRIGFEINNLMALCKECHKNIHLNRYNND